MNNFSDSQQKGFSLLELIIVMSFFLLLITLITTNLLQAKHTAGLLASTDTVISDLKTQQIKAMVGDTEGRASSDNYGIHFDSSEYILFHGNSFTEGDPTNLTVKLEDSIVNQNPEFTVLFLRQSGEVSGFSESNNTLVLKDTGSNAQKTIQFNRFGVITSAN